MATPQQSVTLFRIVRIRNLGNRGFKQRFANQVYVIPPGGEIMAPFDAMISWMGNPAAVNLDARRRDRADENDRLHAKYGAYESAAIWEETKPLLEAYDAVTNERIWTVLDDPEGNQGAGVAAGQAQGAGIAELQAAMAQLTAQIAMLQQQGAQNAAYAQAASQIDEGGDGQGAAIGAPPVHPRPEVDVAVGPEFADPNPPLPSQHAAGSVTEHLADPLPDPTSRATPDTPTRPKTGRGRTG